MEANRSVAISLDAARKIAYVVDRYMGRVLAVLDGLKGCSVTFNASKVMNQISSHAWCLADGRDSDHDEAVEEARGVLKPYLVEDGSSAGYKVYPFFMGYDSELASTLNPVLNATLWYVDDKAYRKIRERVAQFDGIGDYVTPASAFGVFPAEEEILIAAYRRHALGAVNMLRDLSTGWAYLERYLKRAAGKNEYDMVLAPEFVALAAELRSLLDLPKFPPVANGYYSGGGGSSDAVNTLKHWDGPQVDTLLALQAG